MRAMGVLVCNVLALPLFMSVAEDMPSMQIVSDPNDDNDEDANDDN